MTASIGHPGLRDSWDEMQYNQAMKRSYAGDDPAIRDYFQAAAAFMAKQAQEISGSRTEMIGNLRHPNLRLKRDIPIHVFHGEGQWFAEYDDLNLIGSGDDPGDALDEIRRHIVDVYFELTSTKYKLSSHLKAELAFLKDIIEERHGRKTAKS